MKKFPELWFTVVILSALLALKNSICTNNVNQESKSEMPDVPQAG